MLSRRNIRIKVMQVFYAVTAEDQPKVESIVQAYQSKIDAAFELLLFNLFLFTKVAEVSKADLKKRRSKHLPSKIDKAFSAKLYENDLLQSFLADTYIQKVIKKADFEEKAGEIADVVYKKFISAYKDLYEAYILKADNTHEETVEILLTLFKFCFRESELFVETLWAYYPSLIDDDSLILGTTKKIIKSMPLEEGFYKNYLPDSEAVNDFGKELTRYIAKNDAQLLSIIGPELQNWETDRLASLDMILIKLGVAEFLSCPTIPAKVTINEYLELAKAYSTEKSKEFINGVLDRIYKLLQERDQIKKEGRGLID